MKKELLDQIKLLKNNSSQREQTKNAKKSVKIKSEPQKKSQKRITRNNSRQVLSGFGIFKKLVFCFPLVDIDLTPKTVELLTLSIIAQGGQVLEFKDKVLHQKVDYILVNPKLIIDKIRKKIQGKVQYKEILNYEFVQNSLRDNQLHDFQHYSLFANLGLDEQSEKTVYLRQSRKKIKIEEKPENHRQQSQQTVKLMSQDEYQEKRQMIKSCEIKKIGQTNHSMNKFLCEELMKLQKIYQTERDVGRKIAYLKAVSAIRSLDKEIESEKDVENIKGIGKKIIDKIKQLINTGHLNKLQKLQTSERTMTCGEFCKIWGVGPSKAQQLYEYGFKSISDIRKNTNLLNKNQRLGLKYFEDFEKRIPRAKAGKLYEYVKTTLATMVSNIDHYHVQICGSYRRQKESCGDVDIIISRKDGNHEKKLLLDLILELQSKGFLTDHLSFPKPPSGNSSVSYMGVCQFEDQIHHRIDIKHYPINEYSYALFYFTGSGMFNRQIRLHATKIGLQLSDHGAVPRADKNGTIWKGPIPVCLKEEDIFRFLGVDYKLPHQRDL